MPLIIKQIRGEQLIFEMNNCQGRSQRNHVIGQIFQRFKTSKPKKLTVAPQAHLLILISTCFVEFFGVFEMLNIDCGHFLQIYNLSEFRQKICFSQSNDTYGRGGPIIYAQCTQPSVEQKFQQEVRSKTYFIFLKRVTANVWWLN